MLKPSSNHRASYASKGTVKEYQYSIKNIHVEGQFNSTQPLRTSLSKPVVKNFSKLTPGRFSSAYISQGQLKKNQQNLKKNYFSKKDTGKLKNCQDIEREFGRGFIGEESSIFKEENKQNIRFNGQQRQKQQFWRKEQTQQRSRYYKNNGTRNIAKRAKSQTYINPSLQKKQEKAKQKQRQLEKRFNKIKYQNKSQGQQFKEFVIEEPFEVIGQEDSFEKLFIQKDLGGEKNTSQKFSQPIAALKEKNKQLQTKLEENQISYMKLLYENEQLKSQMKILQQNKTTKQNQTQQQIQTLSKGIQTYQTTIKEVMYWLIGNMALFNSWNEDLTTISSISNQTDQLWERLNYLKEQFIDIFNRQLFDYVEKLNIKKQLQSLILSQKYQQKHKKFTKAKTNRKLSHSQNNTQNSCVAQETSRKYQQNYQDFEEQLDNFQAVTSTKPVNKQRKPTISGILSKQQQNSEKQPINKKQVHPSVKLLDTFNQHSLQEQSDQKRFQRLNTIISDLNNDEQNSFANSGIRIEEKNICRKLFEERSQFSEHDQSLLSVGDFPLQLCAGFQHSRQILGRQQERKSRQQSNEQNYFSLGANQEKEPQLETFRTQNAILWPKTQEEVKELQAQMICQVKVNVEQRQNQNYLLLRKGQKVKLIRKIKENVWICQLEQKLGFVRQSILQLTNY